LKLRFELLITWKFLFLFMVLRLSVDILAVELTEALDSRSWVELERVLEVGEVLDGVGGV
jgi:hypothetical protein